MDVLMGLLAALCWGGTDFLVGINARAVGVKKAVFFGQLVGFIIMSLLLLCLPKLSVQAANAYSGGWVAGFIASLFTVSGSLSLSRAFAIGKASIVAPLVTSYGVVTATLSWLSGETLSTTQLVGLGVCLAGVILATLSSEGDEHKKHTSTQSVLYALFAALLYGGSFWLQGKYALPELGATAMLWLGYAVGLMSLTGMLVKEPLPFSLPPMRYYSSLLGASFLNLGGFSTFALGATYGSVAIVTIISTLSGGVAAILGFLFLKERLQPVQVAGVLGVLAGAVVLHLS